MLTILSVLMVLVHFKTGRRFIKPFVEDGVGLFRFKTLNRYMGIILARYP